MGVIGLMILGSIANVFMEDEPDVPDVVTIDFAPTVGMTVGDAEDWVDGQVEGLDLDIEALDYSPLGRYSADFSGTVIVESEGRVTVEPGDTVNVWTLYEEEVAWYENHPTMPKIKTGGEAYLETGYDTEFEAVDELLLQASKSRSDGYSRIELEPDQKRWPYEGAQTVRTKISEWWNVSLADIVTGQYPKAGSNLRPGQPIVVFVKEAPPEPESNGSGSVPVPSMPNSNDDDFDFPDRLCPTRLC